MKFLTKKIREKFFAFALLEQFFHIIDSSDFRILARLDDTSSRRARVLPVCDNADFHRFKVRIALPHG